MLRGVVPKRFTTNPLKKSYNSQGRKNSLKSESTASTGPKWMKAYTTLDYDISTVPLYLQKPTNNNPLNHFYNEVS